jgi:hypothetical protein
MSERIDARAAGGQCERVGDEVRGEPCPDRAGDDGLEPVQLRVDVRRIRVLPRAVDQLVRHSHHRVHGFDVCADALRQRGRGQRERRRVAAHDAPRSGPRRQREVIRG